MGAVPPRAGGSRWLARVSRSPWPPSRSVADRPAVQAPFGTALRALGHARADVVGLSADLAKYTDILPFAEAFPERFFNVGMAEQNMIAMAAGLAKTGLVPYCTTYGVFATRRRVRLRRDRLRPQPPERAHLRRPAWPDHQLRRHPPGHRGPRPDARGPWADRHRPLRRHRDRAARPRHRRRRRPGLRPAASGGRCRWCSTRRATASRSARRGDSARGATSGSSAPGS